MTAAELPRSLTTITRRIGPGWRHTDGRRAVVLWIRRPGRPWAFDMAWRGRQDGETAPVRLTATEISDYVSTPLLTLEYAS